VADLADHLSIPRFGVFGFSSGGPYVYACCRFMPDRITAAAVVSADVPYTEISLDELSDTNKALWYLSRSSATAQLMLKPVLWALYQSCHVAPDSYLQDLLGDDPPDLAIAGMPRFAQMIVAATREGCVQGVDGAVEDVLMERRPWGFALAEIALSAMPSGGEERGSAPLSVRIWHGREDSQLGLNIAEFARSQLRHAQVYAVDGEAHYSVLLLHWERILAGLLDDMRSVTPTIP
jgi:pimeloyl-ACP methyl ester carboxylesterase